MDHRLLSLSCSKVSKKYLIAVFLNERTWTNYDVFDKTQTCWFINMAEWVRDYHNVIAKSSLAWSRSSGKSSKSLQRNDDVIFFFVFKKVLDETTDAGSQDHRSGKSCVLWRTLLPTALFFSITWLQHLLPYLWVKKYK